MKAPPPDYAPLFEMLLDARVMSTRDMHLRFFARKKSEAWDPRRGESSKRRISERASRARIATLMKNGFVHRIDARYPGDRGRGRRFGYALTSSGRAAFRDLAMKFASVARAPGDDGCALLRSALITALGTAGWRVGRGGRAAAHLRRFVLDGSASGAKGALREVLPSLLAGGESGVVDEVWRCPRCSYAGPWAALHRDGALPCLGKLQFEDALPFDVFYRAKDGVPQAGLLLVHDLATDIVPVLRALPLYVEGQQRVPVLMRLGGRGVGPGAPPPATEAGDVLSLLESSPGFVSFDFAPELR